VDFVVCCLNPFVLLLLFYSVKQQNNKTKGFKQKKATRRMVTLIALLLFEYFCLNSFVLLLLFYEVKQQTTKQQTIAINIALFCLNAFI
jgi:hypothetical protein